MYFIIFHLTKSLLPPPLRGAEFLPAPPLRHFCACPPPWLTFLPAPPPAPPPLDHFLPLPRGGGRGGGGLSFQLGGRIG